jgi:hypothetical protein
VPWCEDGNLAALLGFADDAAAAVLAATNISNTPLCPTAGGCAAGGKNFSVGWRFPNFHGGGGDSVPTMMDAEVLRQTLHAMLLQFNRRGELLLFPAWPAGWDVAFKLLAPHATTVEARCVQGKLVDLLVQPESRRKDVRILGCSGVVANGTQHIQVAKSDTMALLTALRSAGVHRQTGNSVHLHLQGRYMLDQPLDLRVAMGLPASSTRPTTMLPRLVVHGPAVLDGGVDVLNWQRDVSNPWLYSAPLPNALRQSNVSVTQMFDGERRVSPARTPILHYEHIGAVNATTGFTQSIIVSTNLSLPHHFKDVSAVRLFLYHAWDISFHPLAQIRLVNNGSLEIIVSNQIKTLWGLGAGAPGFRFFLEGAEEFLHEGSGTFTHDTTAGRLLYAPADGMVPGATVVPHLTELVSGDGLLDVTMDSVTLQHSAVDFHACFEPSSFCEMQSAANLAVAAVHWTNSERIMLVNTTIRHTGGYGLWFDSGCRDTVASHLHLYDLGAGGVRMTAAHNVTLADSVLEDGGQVWRDGVGVLMQVANDSLVTHNSIRRFRYTGISVGWTWGFAENQNSGSVISANEIHTIGQGELSDLGCIYHLGVDPGTVIEGNMCSNVTAYNYGGWGLYLDEGSSNVTVRDNLVFDIKNGGYVQHYGLHNVIENNIFYRVNVGVGPTNISDGGIVSGAADTPGSNEDNSSFTFSRNIVVVDSGQLFAATTKNGYRHMHFSNNVYYGLEPNNTLTFPCNPDENASWITAHSKCLLADPAQTIISSNGQAIVGFDSSGAFTLRHRSGCV